VEGMSTIPEYGYEKTFETRIIRVKHKITFKVGTTRVVDLLEYLNKVPKEAEVDEIDVKDDGIAYIEFHEERRDAEQK
jgi:hypothetical protein